VIDPAQIRWVCPRLSRRRRVVAFLRRLVLLPLALLMAAGSFEFSRAGAQFALDIVTGRNAGPGARTMYLALLTAAPTDASTLSTMTELSTAGYARQAATFSAPSAADPPETHVTGALTFGPFSADPPNVTHFALVSASSGTSGDFVAWGAWGTARDAASGDSLQVAATSGLSLTAT
jgi:hypothetical protein